MTEKYAAELEVKLSLWTGARPAFAGIITAIAGCLPVSVTASGFGDAVLHPLRAEGALQTERVTFVDAVPQLKAALLDQLRRYFSPLASVTTAQFQVGGIEAESAFSLRTEIFYDLIGLLHDGRREQRTGIRQMHWVRSETTAWTIAAWASQQESRSRLAGQGFVDVTHAALGGNATWAPQMNRGVDHWRTVLDGAIGIDVYGNNGIAVGDFDGDGRDDVYVCQAAGLPNRLDRTADYGTRVDVTEQAGVGVLDGTSSALFADLNNNGHQDLIVIRTTGPSSS